MLSMVYGKKIAALPYSAVPNNWGVCNNWWGGWKIFQKLIIGGLE